MAKEKVDTEGFLAVIIGMEIAGELDIPDEMEKKIDELSEKVAKRIMQTFKVEQR